MDMNKSFFLRKEDRAPQWRVIDAKNQILGRLSTQIADILRGKDKPEYTPHTDCGEYVVVLNANKIKLTGSKWDQKEYVSYSGWRSGRKVTTARDMLERHPDQIVRMAVKRMLPKNKLSDQMINKLKIYMDDVHPHEAQVK